MIPRLRKQALSELRPFAPREEGLQPRAESLGKIVPGLMQKLGLAQRLHESQVFHLWAQIVGADIARHTQPVRLQHGRLTILVDHPIWLNELSRYHKKLLLEKVQQVIGKKAVRDLVFQIG